MKNKGKRKVFKGEPVAGGIAIGQAFLFGTRRIPFPKYWIHEGEVKSEIKRFTKSLQACKEALGQIKSKLCRIQGREQITILDSHILLLQDELLVRNTIGTIETEHINAEWAFDKAISEIKLAFSRINQAYFRERKYDINYIENAVQRDLMGKTQEFFQKIKKGSLIVAYDLSPAETLHLIRYRVGGFVTETGGANSHTAIVARSLEIPYVIGVAGLSKAVNDGDTLIIDAGKATVTVHPTKKETHSYRGKQKKQITSDLLMKKEVKREATTLDGHTVKILANMEFVDEIESIRECGTHGIGLYRTEFLFLERAQLPDVREQEKIYRTVLKKLYPREVTIRTVDLGAEKLKPGSQYADQANPALGLRAIRFCMREKKIFVDQLTALLKASKEGHLNICIPMISSLDEFRRAKKMVMDVKDELVKKGNKISDSIRLGVMIETPAAVMEMDLLAAEADFFSVGTNDLIQYLLAVDRTNELVSYLYTPLHPSVIRTLKKITDTAAQYGKEVTLCGEMAADPMYLLLVMALGFNRLSMNSASIPRIKKLIRMTTMEEGMSLLGRVLEGTSYRDNQRVIQSRMLERFPEYFQ